MMRKLMESDEDDDELDRPSPFLQTQRFSKSAQFAPKDVRSNQAKSKHDDRGDMNINLHRFNRDDDDDSLNDSDDDTNTKTGRSTSSGTTSQLTPKPKERSFLKTDSAKPTAKPRHLSVDDDDRNVFGQGTMKPSPRRPVTTLREDEEENQSFASKFSGDKRRQSPTDIFGSNARSDSRKNTRRPSSGRDDDDDGSDSDGNSHSQKLSRQNDFRKGRHSPVESELSKARRDSHRSRDDSDDEDKRSNPLNSNQFVRKRQSVPEQPPNVDSSATAHQPTSSRPSSAGRKDQEPIRRASVCEEQETIIPAVSHVKPQSRPTSAKSTTNRQQTQSVIDAVSSVNQQSTEDPLNSNNEALAAAMQPRHSSPPRPTTQLPPRPKSHTNHTTRSKGKIKVPSQYREITSRIDSGRTPVANMDLTRSVERALQKAIKSQPPPRPQSARTRNQSADSNDSSRRRRRLSSAYEHVQPKVNTNRSINFDELNTSQMRGDSSQTIKDAVYLEWAKAKEDQKQREREERKRWEEAKVKRVDKASVEKQIYSEAQKLERWRQEKDEEIKKKRHEELQIKRELAEKKKREAAVKKKDTDAGFDDWKKTKQEDLQKKKEENEEAKALIERQQEEKQKKILEAQTAYEKWVGRKATVIDKTEEKRKAARKDELKKIQQTEESRFVSAQEAYEKWLKDKEKQEVDESRNGSRRNSFSGKQPQQTVPFLPGGSQRNTGQVRHVVW